ncbi:tRNA (adenosine(37)-N6)-threonylcarbamoyltransferase complex ATPase subunit type 1 TsaE [Melioribacteraceae bacterium 4301-Me]|uniref:tRNA (adenosine(37)-N6)-threonylcarbamoyltransferase complex ATPase subunit type 1 TsaE n=1 Tax=Pyranulibacter aquaticus TaxID=3163344 RepID=UPI003596D7DB
MNFPFQTVVNDESETKKVAEDFSLLLKAGDKILLNGELGTGKTFFVKCVCSAYKINAVSSPSFSIVNEYTNHHKIYHFDFYRIKKTVELYDIGFEDYMNDNNAIVFIEWAELIPEVLPEKCYTVFLKYIDENKREILIKKNN